MPEHEIFEHSTLSPFPSTNTTSQLTTQLTIWVWNSITIDVKNVHKALAVIFRQHKGMRLWKVEVLSQKRWMMCIDVYNICI